MPGGIEGNMQGFHADTLLWARQSMNSQFWATNKIADLSADRDGHTRDEIRSILKERSKFPTK